MPTSTGAKPSIAEVAAWLRRAAEQRDVVEELRPHSGQEAPAVDEEVAGGGEGAERGAGAETAAGVGAPTETIPEPSVEGPSADGPDAPGHQPVALVTDKDDQVPVEAAGDMATDEAEAGPDRPTDRPEAPADPPADEPEPVEAEGLAAPSGSTTEVVEAVEAVEAPAERDTGEATDAPLASSAALATAAAPESEPAGADLHLRDRSEPRADDGPGGDSDLPVPDPVRRPFGIGRSQGGPAEPAVEPPPAVESPRDGEPGTSPDEPAVAPAAGTVGQAAEPATAEAGLEADLEAKVEAVEADTDEDEDTAVPVVEALVDDDLSLAPPEGDGSGADAQPESDPADRGNGHEGGSTERPEPVRAMAGGDTASLFDLDLADLAARARAAGERGEPVPRPHLDPPRRPPALGATAGSSGTVEVDEPEPEPAVSEVRDRTETEEVDELAPAPGGLTWDEEDDQAVRAGDKAAVETADGEAAPSPSLSPSKAKAAAVSMATATLQRRRTKRKRYPRGQLKESIGVLRRVRAMLGVVVLTVVLGVAAGAAIGAFIVFVAFALRSAITTG